MLRIYVPDPEAPFRNALGRYYEVPIPQTIISVPELLAAAEKPFPVADIRWFVVKGEAPQNQHPGCPLTSSIGQMAWGMRFRGRLYVKGTVLAPVLMIRESLLMP